MHRSCDHWMVYSHPSCFMKLVRQEEVYLSGSGTTAFPLAPCQGIVSTSGCSRSIGGSARQPEQELLLQGA